jgi:hypothetical protein
MHVNIIEVRVQPVYLAKLLNEIDICNLSLLIDDKKEVLVRYGCVMEACSNVIREGVNAWEGSNCVSRVGKVNLSVEVGFE